jgi:hypothetical protein
MNRAFRRLQARAGKNARPLTPQTCVLWIPAAKGFLGDFSPGGFRVVETSDLARHYRDEEASRIAIAFRQATGLVAAVRGYVPHGLAARLRGVAA